jgi:hypothetical protein
MYTDSEDEAPQASGKHRRLPSYESIPQEGGRIRRRALFDTDTAAAAAAAAAAGVTSDAALFEGDSEEGDGDDDMRGMFANNTAAGFGGYQGLNPDDDGKWPPQTLSPLYVMFPAFAADDEQ